MDVLIWSGIAFCITQSAMFSGLNLAFFSVSRLRLEVEDSAGNPNASKVLAMRKDSNFLLTTILWGNVGINVLLTLLSNSVMAGVFAFVFSTALITLVGEIMPQAYFSRNALAMASALAPILRFYQFLLYPITKPCAKILDAWLGPEGLYYFRERDFRELIKMHIEAAETDVDQLEGIGALNFLGIDDIKVSMEGEPIDPKSVISLPLKNNTPVFPDFSPSADDSFLHKIEASGKKWVVITDTTGEPQMVLDSDGFLRAALFRSKPFSPYVFCHRPIIVRDNSVALGEVMGQMKVASHKPGDDVIDNDIILVWADEKRVITGSDILGRLLRGISIKPKRSEQAVKNNWNKGVG